MLSVKTREGIAFTHCTSRKCSQKMGGGYVSYVTKKKAPEPFQRRRCIRDETYFLFLLAG